MEIIPDKMIGFIRQIERKNMDHDEANCRNGSQKINLFYSIPAHGNIILCSLIPLPQHAYQSAS
jgi:hypothetical protein